MCGGGAVRWDRGGTIARRVGVSPERFAAAGSLSREPRHPGPDSLGERPFAFVSPPSRRAVQGGAVSRSTPPAPGASPGACSGAGSGVIPPACAWRLPDGSACAPTPESPGRKPGGLQRHRIGSQQANACSSRFSACSSRAVGQARLSRMNPGAPNSRPSEGPSPARTQAATGSPAPVPRQSIQAR